MTTRRERGSKSARLVRLVKEGRDGFRGGMSTVQVEPKAEDLSTAQVGERAKDLITDQVGEGAVDLVSDQVDIPTGWLVSDQSRRLRSLTDVPGRPAFGG